MDGNFSGRQTTGIGRIHVYYGDGKGKTSAGIGAVVRAAGNGFKVLVFQFLKDNTSGEREVLEKLPGVTCLPGKDKVKFASRMSGEERAEAERYNSGMLDEIAELCPSFDMLLLDEALCAVKLGLLGEEKLLYFLGHKPRGLEVILTGHGASERLIGIADYVTEIKKKKHPYDTGLAARRGIEF